MTDLFQPVDLLGLQLTNRIVDVGDDPHPRQRRRRADRADAGLLRPARLGGLIVTECTQVSDQGHGIIRCPASTARPGRRLAQGHRRGPRGRRAHLLQIWHCGRVAHPDMRGGEQPVAHRRSRRRATSSCRAAGSISRCRGPRLERDSRHRRELRPGDPQRPRCRVRRRRAARRQWLPAGPIPAGRQQPPHRRLWRLGREPRAADGGDGRGDDRRLGCRARRRRLSPSSYLYGVDDSDKRATFGYVVERSDALRVAYLCLLEPNAKDAERGVQIEHVAETFRPRDRAADRQHRVRQGEGQRHARPAAAPIWWRSACPTSPIPIWSDASRDDAPLNTPDPSTFYGVGPKGYTDYPALDA